MFEFLATLFYKSNTALKAIENIIMEIAFNLRIHKNLPNTYRIYKIMLHFNNSQKEIAKVFPIFIM